MQCSDDPLANAIAFAIMGAVLAVVFGRKSKTPDDAGSTVLIVAVKQGNIIKAREALNTCPELINERDKKGGTALIYAAIKNQAQIVSLLLDHGADPSIASNKGLTALKIAKNNKYSAIIKLLETVSSIKGAE